MPSPVRRAPARIPGRTRRRVLLLALFLAGCASGGRGGPPPQAGAAPDAAIRAAMHEAADAWNRADLEAHVAMYADSATFMTGAGPRVGRVVIRDVLQRGFWREGRPLQSLRFEELHVRPLGAGHALLTGRFVLSGGGRADQSGRFTTVWERTPDGWRMIHDHSG
ncbi:MAG TPA: nuclear transport factor 2 family protein [Longimicrobiaceae bacterium]|nr:nuclear transport factor 2 family protein [Longimicrobiaceae bacterium]